MGDPILASLALGVAGNVLTNITLLAAEKLEDTPAGSALARLGAFSPSDAKRLRDRIGNAILGAFKDDSRFDSPPIHALLSDRELPKDISRALIFGREGDITDIRNRMDLYISLPDLASELVYTTNVDRDAFIGSFFNHLFFELSNDLEPESLFIAYQSNMILHGMSEIRDSIGLSFEIISKRIADHERAYRRAAHAEFEQYYLQHIRSRFGKLTTPGARDLHGINQSLSVAYISLNVQEKDGAPCRAEEFLNSNPHLIIRGPAGSGKTTLLSWITTKCADSHPGDAWHEVVPFIVPLRTVARTQNGPPTLKNFVNYSVDEQLWDRETPEGWQHDLLSSGRAVVMIDGVDELPAPRRPAFWKWLSDFVELYPKTRVLVTSRTLPGTVGAKGIQHTDSWSPPPHFSDSVLQEMSDEDIGQFIQHWHDAVDTRRLDPDEIASLVKAREQLPSKLRDTTNRRIRELCSTPLLCAMVCVLHWREEGYLPRQRVDLYNKCCEMLIEARDLKREITPPSGPLAFMSAYDKEMVLQRLAFDMMNNRPDGDADDSSTRIEISREKAVKWISPKIASFQAEEARTATAEAVLDFLIERTGLLREPATDLIDFPHRTFQEYLAACAAGADSQEGFLARLADDDQWHETIMLAAGTSTGGVGFGRRLIGALLSRAERHKSQKGSSLRVRKTCFALALGCLENLRQQDPELRDRVLGNLSALVPPRSEMDARILSVAGDAAVAHLQFEKWKEEGDSTLRSCAQALRLVGSSAAIAALRDGYAQSESHSVLAEICRLDALPYNEMPTLLRFVEDVGALPHYATPGDMVLLEGVDKLRNFSLRAPLPKNLETIDRLKSLDAILIEGVELSSVSSIPWPVTISSMAISSCTGTDISWMLKCDLSSISIIECPDIDRIDEVALFKNLTNLSIMESPISDYSPIGMTSSLTSLEISAQSIERDLSWLRSCWRLTNLMLNISDPNIDYSTISVLTKLQSLSIGGPTSAKLPDLSGLKSLSELEIRNANGRSLEGISQAKSLERLSIVNAHSLRSITQVTLLPRLNCLNISGAQDLERLPELKDLEELDEINLSDCPKVKAIPSAKPGGITRLTLVSTGIVTTNPLSTWYNLDQLEMEDVHPIDFEELSDCRSLESISITYNHNIENLSAIAPCKSLKFALISACPRLKSVKTLASLPALTEVVLIGCPNVSDVESLVEAPALRKLYMPRELSGRLSLPNDLLDRVVFDVPHEARFGTRYWGSLRLSSPRATGHLRA